MILTNNILIDNNINVVFVNGFINEVLLRARDYIHRGHKLLSSPLAASGKMNFSPVRSIVLSDKSEGIDTQSVISIENAMHRINEIMVFRNLDYENIEDYKVIDRELLFCALSEIDLTNKNTEV